ncbi:hypothetical protein SLA2020_282670 [Shorea laevis]
MDVDVDHYRVLGLPSGEEGAKLSEDDIKRHTDQRLWNCIQTRGQARKLFDDLLRVKREQQRRRLERDSKHDAKRQKMVSDLEERERAAFASDSSANEREEEEIIAKKLKEEIARIRAMHANKAAIRHRLQVESQPELGRIAWFQEKGSALVVMATKNAAVAATGSACGHLSNPLLVLPLQPPMATETPSAPRSAEPHRPSNLVGASYIAFEDSVLMKLQKAAEKQK